MHEIEYFAVAREGEEERVTVYNIYETVRISVNITLNDSMIIIYEYNYF